MAMDGWMDRRRGIDTRELLPKEDQREARRARDGNKQTAINKALFMNNYRCCSSHNLHTFSSLVGSRLIASYESLLAKLRN